MKSDLLEARMRAMRLAQSGLFKSAELLNEMADEIEELRFDLDTLRLENATLKRALRNSDD